MIAGLKRKALKAKQPPHHPHAALERPGLLAILLTDFMRSGSFGINPVIFAPRHIINTPVDPLAHDKIHHHSNDLVQKTDLFKHLVLIILIQDLIIIQQILVGGLQTGHHPANGTIVQ